jgi:hypothetical protein
MKLNNLSYAGGDTSLKLGIVTRNATENGTNSLTATDNSRQPKV